MASVLAPDRTKVLQPERTLTVTQTIVGEEVSLPHGVRTLAMQSTFAYGSSGTSCKTYLQTSIDAGTTWCDIACHAFATTAAKKVSAIRSHIALAAGVTPTDGSITDNTILDGLIGDRIRVKTVVVGTYAGASSIKVSVVAN
jgi:hypothetical protein